MFTWFAVKAIGPVYLMYFDVRCQHCDFEIKRINQPWKVQPVKKKKRKVGADHDDLGGGAKFHPKDDLFDYWHLGMDQYLLIPFLGGWTSIYQLFWCSLGARVLTHPHLLTMIQNKSALPFGILGSRSMALTPYFSCFMPCQKSKFCKVSPDRIIHQLHLLKLIANNYKHIFADMI